MLQHAACANELPSCENQCSTGYDTPAQSQIATVLACTDVGAGGPEEAKKRTALLNRLLKRYTQELVSSTSTKRNITIAARAVGELARATRISLGDKVRAPAVRSPLRMFASEICQCVSRVAWPAKHAACVNLRCMAQSFLSVQTPWLPSPAVMGTLRNAVRNHCALQRAEMKREAPHFLLTHIAKLLMPWPCL